MSSSSCDNTEDEIHNGYQYDEYGEIIMPNFNSLELFPLRHEIPSPTLPVIGHGKFLMYHIIRALPLDYISLDPQRIVALHFALIGIDILNQLPMILTNETLTHDLIEFVYNLQIKGHGFAGSPLLNTNNSLTTPGNLAATYSAICILKTLGDDLSRIDIDSIITLINNLIVYMPINPFQPNSIVSDFANSQYYERQQQQQQPHHQQEQEETELEIHNTSNHKCCQEHYKQIPLGPFYASSTRDEFDVRYLFCAMALCHFLNIWDKVNIQPYQIFNYIQSCQTYEGGFNLTDLGQEAHGGATHTALISYWLLLDFIVTRISTIKTTTTTTITKDEQNKQLEIILGSLWPKNELNQYQQLPLFHIDRLEKWLISLQGDGFRGRTNKARDCCYTYWLGSLIQLFGLQTLSEPYNNAYFVTLCENLQRGGFGRDEDRESEILHTFYAIAGLSLANNALQLQEEEINNNNKNNNEKESINDVDMTTSSTIIPTTNNDPEKNEENEIDKQKKLIHKDWLQLNPIDPVMGLSIKALHNPTVLSTTPYNSTRKQFKQLIHEFNHTLSTLQPSVIDQ